MLFSQSAVVKKRAEMLRAPGFYGERRGGGKEVKERWKEDARHQPFNHFNNEPCDCRSPHLKRFHPDGNYWFNIQEDGIEH
ncbi:hypothetical protein Q5P01_005587 [Channa striata]|uniref:Uncharacterized protein n=1 Tax=Channa striata TaxID=64152 RepID=A0AA88NGQ6_CHASR|nr:hypothetical protein Q5P01_005587 [Channa striata]